MPSTRSSPRSRRLRDVAVAPAGGRHPVHLQPHGNLLRGRARRHGPHPGLAGALGRRVARAAALACLHAARRTGRPPRLPRGQRARFDGAGRAPDPGPDEGCGARRRPGRRPGHHAQPAVPAFLCRRQGSAHLHRDRRPFDQHGGRGGAAGRPAVRGHGQDPRAVRRRRRNGRTGRHPLRRPQPQGHRHRQPHAGARRAAGLALRRRGDAAGRPARRACTNSTP